MDDELDDIERAILNVKKVLYLYKPDDRTPADRFYAVMLTDIEKLYAYYEIYAKPKPGE